MVSVIIPVYNGERHLEECLKSVVEQSYRDLEIIIIDDGSTDNSYKICESFAAQDNRIRLIHQENKGVSEARNRGLDCVMGEYITFLDADDKLPKDAVGILLNGMHSGVDFVVGSHEMFRLRKRQVIKPNATISINDPDEMKNFDELVYMVCAKLYRSDIILNNDLRFRKGVPYGEDTLFNISYCEHITKIRVISDIVYSCRCGGVASSVRYYPDMDRISVGLLDAFFGFTRKNVGESPTLEIKMIKNHLTHNILHFVVNCSRKELKNKVQEMLSQYSDFMKKWGLDYQESFPKLIGYVVKLDATSVIKTIHKDHFLRVLLRKGKILYYKQFLYH